MSDSIFRDEQVPLPRPKRERRRPKADLGLPPDEELRRLATDYLATQRKNWPKLAGFLPEATEEVLTQMVEDFKDRHRAGKIDPEPLRIYTQFGAKLGGNYDSYSCENSNPRSVCDQMVNSLEKARQEDRFVPWQYVFADYSVSGLNPARQGYSSYKAVLQDSNHSIETTYIDDFSRASRDEVEWWRLAYLSRRLQKRMIGASDGFDVTSQNWDMTMTVFGLLSRLFIKSCKKRFAEECVARFGEAPASANSRSGSLGPRSATRMGTSPETPMAFPLRFRARMRQHVSTENSCMNCSS